MAVVLRKATPQDIPKLAVMSRALSEASGSAHMPLAKHETRVRRESKSHITELILLDGGVVGYLVYLCQEDPEDKIFVLQLRRLFVEAAQRRQGVGREALRQLLERFPKGTQIFLAVKPENKTALAFYKALDFDVSLLTMKRVL